MHQQIYLRFENFKFVFCPIWKTKSASNVLTFHTFIATIRQCSSFQCRAQITDFIGSVVHLFFLLLIFNFYIDLQETLSLYPKLRYSVRSFIPFPCSRHLRERTSSSGIFQALSNSGNIASPQNRSKKANTLPRTRYILRLNFCGNKKIEYEHLEREKCEIYFQVCKLFSRNQYQKQWLLVFPSSMTNTL